MPIHITSLETEHFKRVRAVALTPTPQGLTVIGGRNGQGKTSVLNSIMFGLGGASFKPSDVDNYTDKQSAKIRIALSNGLVITRQGKNADLKVTDQSGLKGSQTILERLIDKLALNLPKFLQATAKEKAQILLRLVGGGGDLARLDADEKKLYDDRTDFGRSRDSATKVLESMTRAEAPTEPVSVSGLLAEVNTANVLLSDKRNCVARIKRFRDQITSSRSLIADLQNSIESREVEIDQLNECIEDSQKELDATQVPDTEPLMQQIKDAEGINEKVRQNVEYDRKVKDLDELNLSYAEIDQDLASVRDQRQSLLSGLSMPLEGLSVQDGELVYNKSKWDCMSSADQLKVATSIVKELNPNCGFVLLDKLEQMDVQTMIEFGEWAESQGLQIIATRVSTGDECSVIIEDGQLVESATD